MSHMNPKKFTLTTAFACLAVVELCFVFIAVA